MADLIFEIIGNCPPYEVEVQGFGGGPWQFLTEGEQTITDNFPEGEFTVQITDNCGCIAYAQVCFLATTSTTTIEPTTTTTTTIPIPDGFIFELTLAAPTSITLPLHETYDDTAVYGDGTPASYDFTVYWDYEGDKSEKSDVSAYNDPTITHNYLSAGTYVVVITAEGTTTGQCQAFATKAPLDSINEPIATYITKVYKWGTLADFRMLNLFGCLSLTDLPHDIVGNPYEDYPGQFDGTVTGAALIKSFENFICWCSSYAHEINENFFTETPDVLSFKLAFAYSGVYGTIPDDLFALCPEVTIFSNTFESTIIGWNGGYVSSLNPVTLFANNTKATHFDRTFYYCEYMTSGVLTTDLFANNPDVTTFNRCFMFCKKLNTALPANFFYYNEAVIDFGWCFSNTWDIPGTIPAGLFATNSGLDRICLYMDGLFWISGSGAYSSLSGTIPSTLFSNCPLVTTFQGTFRWQFSLSLAPNELFRYNTAAIVFAQTFQACNSMDVEQYVFSEANDGAALTRFTGQTLNFTKCFEMGEAGYSGGSQRFAPEVWNPAKYQMTSATGTDCFSWENGGVHQSIASIYSNYCDIPFGWGNEVDECTTTTTTISP